LFYYKKYSSWPAIALRALQPDTLTDAPSGKFQELQIMCAHYSVDEFILVSTEIVYTKFLTCLRRNAQPC